MHFRYAVHLFCSRKILKTCTIQSYVSQSITSLLVSDFSLFCENKQSISIHLIYRKILSCLQKWNIESGSQTLHSGGRNELSFSCSRTVLHIRKRQLKSRTHSTIFNGWKSGSTRKEAIGYWRRWVWWRNSEEEVRANSNPIDIVEHSNYTDWFDDVEFLPFCGTKLWLWMPAIKKLPISGQNRTVREAILK